MIVLCNVLPANPGRVARDLAAIAFGEPHEQPRTRKVAVVDPEVHDVSMGRHEKALGGVALAAAPAGRPGPIPVGKVKWHQFPALDG